MLPIIRPILQHRHSQLDQIIYTFTAGGGGVENDADCIGILLEHDKVVIGGLTSLAQRPHPLPKPLPVVIHFYFRFNKVCRSIVLKFDRITPALGSLSNTFSSHKHVTAMIQPHLSAHDWRVAVTDFAACNLYDTSCHPITSSFAMSRVATFPTNLSM